MLAIIGHYVSFALIKMAAALSTDTTDGDRLIDLLQNSKALPRTVGK